MGRKSISVVMATYNGGKYITEQLDSIISQTFSPAEIIVCDDNSSDHTLEILKQYADRNLIKLFVNNPGLGVIKNFQKAASLADKLNLLAFADQDDIWSPDKLKKLVEELELTIDDSKPGMVFSDSKIIDHEGKTINESLWNVFGINPDKQTIKTFLTRNIVPGCNMLINSKMRDEFLAMPAEAYMHDAWITLTACIYHNYSYLKEPLVYYRQHDNNVTYSTSSTETKQSLLSKINEYIIGVTFNKKLFERELKTASLFFNKNHGVMGAGHLTAFSDFLNLETKNFLKKKMHVRYINKIERP